MTGTTRERHDALVQQQHDLIAQRDSLKAEHAQALIDGETFSKQQQISSLNHEIEAMDVAIAALDSQATKEEARAYAANQADALQQNIDDILSDEADYLDLVKQLEGHYAKSMDLLKKIHACASDMSDKIIPVIKTGNLTELASQTIAIRISEKFGIFLSRVLAPGYYGIFHWAAQHDRDCNWVDEERKALSGITQHSIKVLKGRIEDLRGEAAEE
ncbi:hypothetical protein [Rhizobium rhizogenes]|uniref:hypothetical protein n=1 Tax=Rhizobium rhizogenes TaxID=359 RepID=UPI0024BEAF08|nr:hypothetical protein [Rhizobium rhizogenes]MDJ1633203.1 hypothetical protein [Rhizobium rhizogenes]